MKGKQIAGPGSPARAAGGSLSPDSPPSSGGRPERERLLRERSELLEELEEVYEEFSALLMSSRLERAVTYRELRRRLESLEKANELLRQTQEDMVRAERLMAMGEMAAEIGHELNNYLAVLGGRAELVGRALERGEVERAQEYSRVVVEQVDKMHRLTRSLTDFSRQGTEKSLEDPAELVVDAVQLLAVAARRASVSLEAGCPGGLPRISVDRAQVEQLLVNLIKNAIEAVAEQKEGHVLVGAYFDWEKEELHFRVQDNGPGIKPELRSRLFEPHVSSKEGSRGFGLAVAYRIARNHQGGLKVESGEERGTSFIFSVPLEAPSKEGTGLMPVEAFLERPGGL